MLVPVESCNNNILKVQMWLVTATRPQARYLSFRLRISSTTPSVGTSVIIGFSGQFQWKGHFQSYNHGWRSAWVNRHNSRQDYNMCSSSIGQKWTGGWFSNNTSDKEIGDHDITWQDGSGFYHVKMFSGPWLRKGEPSELEIEPSGVTEDERHEDMPLDGSGEHEGSPRVNKWTYFDVAFMEIWGSSPHSVDTSWQVVVFESTNKTSAETFITDVNSGLTAQHF
jgi:hypothetical protein